MCRRSFDFFRRRLLVFSLRNNGLREAVVTDAFFVFEHFFYSSATAIVICIFVHVNKFVLIFEHILHELCTGWYHTLLLTVWFLIGTPWIRLRILCKCIVWSCPQAYKSIVWPFFMRLACAVRFFCAQRAWRFLPQRTERRTVTKMLVLHFFKKTVFFYSFVWQLQPGPAIYLTVGSGRARPISLCPGCRQGACWCALIHVYSAKSWLPGPGGYIFWRSYRPTYNEYILLRAHYDDQPRDYLYQRDLFGRIQYVGRAVTSPRLSMKDVSGYGCMKKI